MGGISAYDYLFRHIRGSFGRDIMVVDSRLPSSRSFNLQAFKLLITTSELVHLLMSQPRSTKAQTTIDLDVSCK